MRLRQPLARRRWQQIRRVGRVRPEGLHAAIRSDRIAPVSIDFFPRSRHRAGALASGSPGGEGARRAGYPSGVARSAHEAGLTGGDSTAVAGLRPGRVLRSREARGCAPMRPGPRGNPEHSARADHAPAPTTRPRGRTRSMAYTLLGGWCQTAPGEKSSSQVIDLDRVFLARLLPKTINTSLLEHRSG